jgi:hypothetical protein
MKYKRRLAEREVAKEDIQIGTILLNKSLSQ